MKLGIMQPYFFPYVGYWQLINAVDKYVIYDDVNYIKNGWINRNYILLNGQKHLITLPLDGSSPFKPIKETKIISKNVIKEKLLKTLAQAYQKTPHFKDVMPIVENTIMHPSNNITEALVYSIKSVAEYLNFKTDILVSSQIEKNNELKGVDKVLHICGILKADEYFNAIGGIDLYDKKIFSDNKIKLSFVRTGEFKYNQFNNNFIPNLSIIDVMMFNSREKVKVYLDSFYTLL